jgi:hypothetical protein
MTGWTVPPSAAVPPGVGLAPAPGVGMAYQPEDERPEEENLVRQHDWALEDAEADQHKSTDELRKDAERSRERVNSSVLELRERLGLEPDAEHAHGPFGPMRRHPFTVAVATLGAATAAIVGVTLARGHRKSAKEAARAAAMDAFKATERRRKAAVKASAKRRKAARKAAHQRWNDAKDLIGSAASVVRKPRKKGLRRFTKS